MDRFDQIFTKASDRLAFWTCGVIVLIMVLYVGANVFSRYVLRIGGVIGCYSFVGALFVPFIYLGLSCAWYKGGYIVLDIVQARLKGRVLWGFQFAFLLLTLVFFAVLCYGAYLSTVEVYLARAVVGVPTMLTPRWPWHATIIIGTFLVAIRNILDLVRMVRMGEVIPTDR